MTTATGTQIHQLSGMVTASQKPHRRRNKTMPGWLPRLGVIARAVASTFMEPPLSTSSPDRILLNAPSFLSSAGPEPAAVGKSKAGVGFSARRALRETSRVAR